ncbi:MAG TPA: rod shape-determining protein MreC [Anaerolineae bacterium]|nr:rod shape-determining protein MreC [Anaerolineae bacterium]
MNRNRSRTLPLLIFTLIAIALLVLHEGGQLQPIEDVAQTVFGPVERAVSGLFNGVGDLFSAVRDLRELRDRNALLEKANQDLLTENARLTGLQSENDALKALLNFTQENPTYQYQTAAVIGRDPSPYVRFITINAGSREGLKKDMPVVTAGGTLIGRIDQVNLRSSKVQLLNDPSSAVNVRLQTSGITGLVIGQSSGLLRMQYIPLEAKLSSDDIALTSGLGGNLPRGLVVGQVITIEKRDVDLFQSAQLTPAADYERLDVVLVITNFIPIDNSVPTSTSTPAPAP